MSDQKTEQKHTPGPWSHRNGRIFQTDRPELTVANVARAHDGDYSSANGNLLAVAPELLEALREAVEREHNPFEPDNQSSYHLRWSALIAKATGERHD